MRNELCAEIGYRSIRHAGEQLCGDHVDITEQEDGSLVIVLADGLGSGVKASILSTLTSKILSTMLAAGLSIDECVSTIVSTLPVCSERNVAYSTFTIIHLIRDRIAEITQYDNPMMIMIRDSEIFDYPKKERMIGDKKIIFSTIRLQAGDVFIAMSDGCPYAGTEAELNYNWKLEDIAEFMAQMSVAGYTAKGLCSLLIDECDRLYGGKPGDDATACVVKIRERVPMNIMFGPPSDRDDCERMMSLFFSKEGKHIVCGGTTAAITADWLHKPMNVTNLPEQGSDIPPIAEIEGVDLVTEGVITMNRVLENAQDYLGKNENYDAWNFGRDGASRICQMLFEEGTDINFFVGRAKNPAHQSADNPMNFNVKMSIADSLAECLKKMGKQVKVNYF